MPGWLGLVHTHEAQSVLERLDRAFEAFGRRCKRGETLGFPRFHSLDRFSGWGYLRRLAAVSIIHPTLAPAGSLAAFPHCPGAIASLFC
jgi:hypothetical protein